MFTNRETSISLPTQLPDIGPTKFPTTFHIKFITESYPKHRQEIEARLAKVRTQNLDAPISPETHAALIKSIKEGSGDVNLALILLHGAPSVGKSSLHRILQGLPPLLKSQQHSTELLQNPVCLINTNRLALTATHVLEHVDERKVMNMIAAHISRQGKESTTEEIPQATSKNTPQTNLRHTLPSLRASKKGLGCKPSTNLIAWRTISRKVQSTSYTTGTTTTTQKPTT